MKNKILILGILALISVNVSAGWAKHRDRIINGLKYSIENNNAQNYSSYQNNYNDDYDDDDYDYDSENLYYYGELATVDGFFEVKNIQLETRTAKAYFITLDEPVTLLPSEGYVGEADNKVIQLLITNKNVDYLNGKRVRIKGPFFHSETEYHSTPVVFEVLEIDVLN